MESDQVIKRDDYGGSLPVDNVQALASRNLTEIPPRYLRHDIEFDQVSGEDSLDQIPVIDMSKLLDDHEHPLGHHDELEKLHLACKEWGFFQLIKHGVAEEVTEKMKKDMEEFFNLPLEKKQAFSQPPNSIEGYGQAFVVSEEQKLDWGDMLFLLPLPDSLRNMKLWPTDPSSFQESLDKYSWELHRVTMLLLKFMSRNLGLNPMTLPSVFEDATQGVRMNYYPPCVLANKVMGLAPHSDATGLTLLLQVNDVQGLQIKKNGKWLPVKPVPGAFIVNIGDVIEIMSNGEYKSIEHRAVVNPEKQRLSIAAFHSPDLTTMIGPLPDLVKDNNNNNNYYYYYNYNVKAHYKTITHHDYVRLIVGTKLDGKSTLDLMKLS